MESKIQLSGKIPTNPTTHRRLPRRPADVASRLVVSPRKLPATHLRGRVPLRTGSNQNSENRRCRTFVPRPACCRSPPARVGGSMGRDKCLSAHTPMSADPKATTTPQPRPRPSSMRLWTAVSLRRPWGPTRGHPADPEATGASSSFKAPIGGSQPSAPKLDLFVLSQYFSSKYAIFPEGLNNRVNNTSVCLK